MWLERREEAGQIVYKGSEAGTKLFAAVLAFMIAFFQLLDYHASVLTCTSSRTRQFEGHHHAVVTQAECVLVLQTLGSFLARQDAASHRFTTDEVDSVYIHIRYESQGTDEESKFHQVQYRLSNKPEPLTHREFSNAHDAHEFLAQIEAYLGRIREPHAGESAPQVFELVEDFKVDDVIFWILVFVLAMLVVYAPASETLVFDQTHYDMYYEQKNLLGLILARPSRDNGGMCPSRLGLGSIVRFGEITEISDTTTDEERRRGEVRRSFSYIIAVVVRSIENPREELTYKMLARTKSASSRVVIAATIERLNADLHRLQASHVQGSPSPEAAPDTRESDPDRGICVICCTNAANMVLIPCGHITLCIQCAPAVDQCPLCRSFCSQKQRVFFP